jgi:hypothetical protein
MKSNTFPKPPENKSISASVSASISASPSIGETYEEKLENWQKCKDQFEADTERLKSATSPDEYIRTVKDILSFWVNEGQSYKSWIILQIRSLAIRHGLGVVPGDLIGIRLWIADKMRSKTEVKDVSVDEYQVQILDYLY